MDVNNYPYHLQKHQLTLVKSNVQREHDIAMSHRSEFTRTQLYAACQLLMFLTAQQESLTGNCLGLPLKTLGLAYPIEFEFLGAQMLEPHHQYFVSVGLNFRFKSSSGEQESKFCFGMLFVVTISLTVFPCP